MTYVKLEDAVKAVESYCPAERWMQELNIAIGETARNEIADSLRALPADKIVINGPTDEAIDSALKAYNYKYFGDYELSKDQMDAVHTMVSAMEAFKNLRATLTGTKSELANIGKQ